MRSARLVSLGVVCGVVGASGAAWALEQPEHYDVTHTACVGAGLPEAFCARAGTEAYNVDRYEFDDMAAHAQTAGGQPLCDGANATMARVHGLGQEVQASLLLMDSSAAAKALGRALHTLQDNCAHAGMSNPEHAWYSLQDSCEGTSLTPDKAPEAAICAAAETELAVASFLEALAANELAAESLGDAAQVDKKKYTYTDGCEFLGEAENWDGHDAVWNGPVVAVALRDDLVRGWSAAEPASDVCGGDPSALDMAPEPDVDVSDGTPSCWKVHLYCLGKADTVPWASPAPATPPPVAEDEGGCSLGAHRVDGGATPLGLGVLALGLVARRRRRR